MFSDESIDENDESACKQQYTGQIAKNGKERSVGCLFLEIMDKSVRYVDVVFIESDFISLDMYTNILLGSGT